MLATIMRIGKGFVILPNPVHHGNRLPPTPEQTAAAWPFLAVMLGFVIIGLGFLIYMLYQEICDLYRK